MREYPDLTGKQFNKYTVKAFYGINKHRKRTWLCVCECGKEKVITGSDLISGHIKSCGCILSKHNKAVFKGQYIEMHTTNNKKFLIDQEDFERVKNICWHTDYNGYVIGRIKGKEVKLHRYLTNCPDNKIVDHINQNKSDNRKSNLRIVGYSQNNMNKPLQKNNTSGFVGISYDKIRKKWKAYITINKKTIYLGIYSDLNKAIESRQEAEKNYFGEYSFTESQKVQK